MNITSTDCRSKEGVTVGLIDGIIAMARVLKTMDQSSPEVQEALKDLRSDEDFLALVGAESGDKMTPEKAFKTWSTWIKAYGPLDEVSLVHDLFFKKGHVPGEKPYVGHTPGENPFAGLDSKTCEGMLKVLWSVGLSRYK